MCLRRLKLETSTASSSLRHNTVRVRQKDILAENENVCKSDCNYKPKISKRLVQQKHDDIPVCSYTSDGILTCQDSHFWQAQKANPHFEYEQQLLPIHQRVEVIEAELEDLKNSK